MGFMLPWTYSKNWPDQPDTVHQDENFIILASLDRHVWVRPIPIPIINPFFQCTILR